jgi:hypothetical protein
VFGVAQLSQWNLVEHRSEGRWVIFFHCLKASDQTSGRIVLKPSSPCGVAAVCTAPTE